MKKNSTLTELIHQMPKVELHVHLEGAFSFESLFELIRKYDPAAEIKTIADLKKKFIFQDFEHFINIWFWKNSFFRQPEDFEFTTYHTLKNFSEQNIIYVEAFFSPWDFAANNLSAVAIARAHLSAIKQAEKDFGIKANLIADISRDAGFENSVERFQQILPFRNQGIIGIGLGGSEQQYPNELFENVFRRARAEGFHVVAHAGEAAGPESVRSALDVLKAERIGHGVHAIEDIALIERLKQLFLPLEICVTSNLKTGVFKSLIQHPIRKFLDLGLNVTINSDDPTMFATSLTQEFLFLAENSCLTAPELKQLTVNAVGASFLSSLEKEWLMTKINAFWNGQ